MKKIAVLLLALLLPFACAQAQPRQAEELLGQPMGDFSFTDTQGQTHSLSGLLSEKKLVVLSLFASWCGPCQMEFPEMEKVQRRHSGEMAVVALSAYEGDTMEDMEDFRQTYAPEIPMGLAAGTGILDAVQIYAYPTNLMIDRYGNICYAMAGAFPSEVAFERTVRTFLMEDYPETVTLAEMPDPETEIILTNEGARPAEVMWEGQETGIFFFILPDEEAVFALRVGADADPLASFLSSNLTEEEVPLSSLPQEEGGYVYTCAAPGKGEVLYAVLSASYGGALESAAAALVSGEDNAEAFLLPYLEAGYDVTWQYADAESR